MKSIAVSALAVLTCIFSLVSWSIAAHLLPFFQAASKDHMIDSGWDSDSDGGFGSGYGSGNGYGWGSGSDTGSNYGSGYGSGYGSNASSGCASGYTSVRGYCYSLASTGASSYTIHGLKAPLAVIAVGMAFSILLFLFAPPLALYAWRERRTEASVPRWLNRTVLALSIVCFAIAIAQFGVYGHYKMLADEPAAEAAMLFLAAIFGTTATVIPHLPTAWLDKLTLPGQSSSNIAAAEAKNDDEAKHKPDGTSDRA